MNTEATPYIVGGESADISKTPWMVSIRKSGRSHTCGGVLIDAKTILSAGHCFANDNGEYVAVMNQSEEIGLDRIYVHEEYNPTTFVNDVSVAQLKNPSKVTEFVTLNKDAVDRKKARVIGWGLERVKGEMSNSLKGLDVQVSGGDTCGGVKYFDTKLSICASTPGTNDTPCNGDSGGPLFIEPNNVIGIVSNGDFCKGVA
ncbi:Suppressor of tumorigenicity 14 protein, partial [Massospora cicadina]